MNTAPLDGDFGGKGSLMDSVVCYHLAAQSSRPVKMVMTYTEDLLAGNPRHAATMMLKTGVDAEGRITARKAKLIFSCGAHGAFTPLHTVHSGVRLCGWPVPHPARGYRGFPDLYQYRAGRTYAGAGCATSRVYG